MQEQLFRISIVFTSVVIMLCFAVFYASPKFAFCNECSVEMNVYHIELGNRFNHTLEDALKNKKYDNYELTGNSKIDEEIFKNYRNAVRLMNTSIDTTQVIHFKFNRVTTYQKFIDAFDTCYIEDVYYVYSKNDLWIMNKCMITDYNKHLFNPSSYSNNEYRE